MSTNLNHLICYKNMKISQYYQVQLKRVREMEIVSMGFQDILKRGWKRFALTLRLILPI